MSLKITIDPGHSKNVNKSPNNKAYIEGTQMWKLANKLKTALESYGFEVVTTRPNLADNPELSARGSLSGKNGSCMFLSLHSNAPGKSADGTYSKLATGSVVYYSMTRKETKPLADKLGNKVSEIMGHYYRGSATKQYPGKPGVDYYAVIREASKSGCKCAMLIEHGFHTNIADSNFLLDDGNLQKLAEAEAAIIADHFGQKKEVTPTELYRVRKTWADSKSQLGAFQVLSRAKALADKNPGFYVFDSKGVAVYPVDIKKSIDDLAKEVISGKWGNGTARKKALTNAGYDYCAVQKRVNEMLLK